MQRPILIYVLKDFYLTTKMPSYAILSDVMHSFFYWMRDGKMEKFLGAFLRQSINHNLAKTISTNFKSPFRSDPESKIPALQHTGNFLFMIVFIIVFLHISWGEFWWDITLYGSICCVTFVSCKIALFKNMTKCTMDSTYYRSKCINPKSCIVFFRQKDLNPGAYHINKIWA